LFLPDKIYLRNLRNTVKAVATNIWKMRNIEVLSYSCYVIILLKFNAFEWVIFDALSRKFIVVKPL
jgi:hypothetical protein